MITNPPPARDRMHHRKERPCTLLSFDLVLVGAGPSALGLIYGLIERQKIYDGRRFLPFTVAVLEQGAPPRDLSEQTPEDWFLASHHGKRSRLSSAPQSGLGGRVVTVPVGEGVGGTTNINACLVATPPEEDFELWPELWRGDRLVRASEHMAHVMRQNRHLEERQLGGSVNLKPFGFVTDAIGSSASRAQFPSFVSRVATATRVDGVGKRHRVNYFEAILKPVLTENPDLKESVKFLEGWSVERILLDGKGRAFGVECQVKDAMITVEAKSEVILCAGAIFSPALLMVSGIGPRQIVEGLCIPSKEIRETRCGWELIGKRLKDHVVLPRGLLLPPQLWAEKSVNSTCCWYNLLAERDDADQSDPSCSSVLQIAITDGVCSTHLIPHFVASLIRRRSMRGVEAVLSKAFWAIRACLSFIFVWTPIGLAAKYCTATINVCLLNPESNGTVSVRTVNQSSRHAHNENRTRLRDLEVIVDPGYLSDPRDVASLQKGWDVTNTVRSRHFGTCMEILPSIFYRSFLPWIRNSSRHESGWFRQYAKDLACPYFHWYGTCCMGDNDEAHVVNSRLQVTGVKRLRICDASVIPNISSPPALVCAGLGYAFSELLLADIGLHNGSEGMKKVS